MRVAPEIPDVPFTWVQAQASGLSRAALTELVACGRVRRVLRGVYQRADVPDTVENRLRAAALVLSPFVVACDRTAAWLHGVDTFEYRELEILPPLEVVALRGRSRTVRTGCSGGERDLSQQDVQRLGEMWLTTPLRTALDLGCKLSRRDALAALDGFMRVCGITREGLLRELPRYFRRRGVIQLRQLIPLADARAESSGESWTRLCIVDGGLPVPELQHWVTQHGRPVFRLDLAYPRHKVAVEYDGVDFHTSDAQREADALRRRWLREHGWTVIVVTKEDFEPDRLAAWLVELRTALRVAA